MSHDKPYTTAAKALSIAVLAVVGIGIFPTSFSPEFQPNHFVCPDGSLAYETPGFNDGRVRIVGNTVLLDMAAAECRKP